MSFRNRLTLFFVLIVVVPMIAVGFVLFHLIATNESGKADAKLAARQETAIALAGAAREDANVAALAIGRDVGLAQALRAADRPALEARMRALLGTRDARRIVVSRDGRPLADVGSSTATFPASRALVDRSRGELGLLQVSVEEPGEYAALVRKATGQQVVVQRAGGPVLASTLREVDVDRLPSGHGRVEVAGREFSAASFEPPGFLGDRLKVSVLSPAAQEADAVRRNRLIAGALLGGFFILAFTFALIVSRSLQRQVGSLLQAARRLGSGDFSAKVPTTGHDELAMLGEEFNKMSSQLQLRLDELAEERVRLQHAMRRIGDTFASNLDREGLLDIVVRTAVEGVGADAGRASVRPGPHQPLEHAAVAGELDAESASPAVAAALAEAVGAAEAQVLETGQASEATVDGVSALSHPLRPDEAHVVISGIVSVARRGRPFGDTERDLFHYLATQAAVSIENVGLHEAVERQAVTDDLTGLSNRRRFEEVIASEVGRAKRFGQPLGLVLLDLDDFKAINDTFGHQQGDVVLREVARVLRESSREIDEPARYGGEELAVILPGTDLDGAFNLAERVRAGIAALELGLLDGQGTLKLTASFGVATLPASAANLRELVAAADEALYRAKRAGKNRTMRAEPSTRL
jgi:diguanylate cyclase (GGDEF)-like protein